MIADILCTYYDLLKMDSMKQGLSRRDVTMLETLQEQEGCHEKREI
jgi:hypothetical protein